ncbi:uncharacterized protein LY89DRAFT_675494 [Mollisia scopiformis]|uniref:Uncharacterized protein n=1 Tax=Mollisia scopiformis TaxID=149040 RepID=A0A132BC91_MOLSC|nr:uncharacterized protein LY89DRAFT_675494 [Mollisia scopiformis]KUJ09988.1 hypothetical protein LY89DRAFT_675494 [Mollisia scopiformis]
MCVGSIVRHSCGHVMIHWLSQCDESDCQSRSHVERQSREVYHNSNVAKSGDRCWPCQNPWEKAKMAAMEAKDKIPEDIKNLDSKLEKLIQACELNTSEVKSGSDTVVKALQTHKPDIHAKGLTSSKQGLQKAAAIGITAPITFGLKLLEDDIAELHKVFSNQIAALNISGSENAIVKKVLTEGCQSMVDSVAHKLREAQANIAKSTDGAVVQVLDSFV